ncbi:NOL1/NOP2/sun family putative RNA methylase [Heliobacillus mobilis]|uniref:NOL1/NOP2/sun family putative RNA methylase n=2 Tax=Heliobacterium mobile TaxID=28064 RepID=A0A6I3SLY5_HELMO|nr:RsmF rRNA methyltransferase first C-terminal domain-containing protein [Heliobacterium mobile]MTV49978.1 NOL1/NOP2/sun family putative RNA methylase [Heliobacterium mobile]
MINVPEEFQSRIKQILPEDEFNRFMQSYQENPAQGLRLNPLKGVNPEILPSIPVTPTPVPWCDFGYYYEEGQRPGKHPFHAAGLYYIQEPSAMAVVEALQPEPGERILDLCAAPGGKATQIAGYLRHEGLLVANEIHPKRNKALSENLERWGARNILVTNEPPDKLSRWFPEYFDRIVVDAPCSGEGMFRKLPEAIEDWSEEKVAHCAALQQEILPEAVKMLKPGGVMVYSTCTFSAEENEKQIETFLEMYPEFTLEPVLCAEFFQAATLPHTVRLWPHKLRGEGHFIARLRKRNSLDSAIGPSVNRASRESAKAKKGPDRGRKEQNLSASLPSLPADVYRWYERFCQESLNTVPQGPYLLFGDQLYAVSEELPSLERLKVTRTGLHLGTIKKGRFEPAHALALALSPGEWKKSVDLSPDSDEVYRYLRGESLSVPNRDGGWTIVTVSGYPIGWGKVAEGQLKNHYPKGLRWT